MIVTVIVIVILRSFVKQFLCAVTVVAVAVPASAQTPMHATARFGAHAVPLLTHAEPMLRGASYTEAYLTQPIVLADASVFGGRVTAHATVSLEPLTLKRGELGAGTYGEGYVDRRHPHTYAHELIVSVQGRLARVGASITAGRGFVPFGTDDPMMRPFVKYPVNHHLGQILERLVAIAAVRVGPVLAEAALFNGDEPLTTSDWGTVDRFADSWSVRLTVTPVTGVELQGSRAWVVSPEMPPGGGWDQRKWSGSARYAREHAVGRVYALAEWKRTTQVSLGRDLFSFGSVLIESALERGGLRPAVRLERTERPEEERLFDPFRSPWPHGDLHVLGITRWTIASARVERALELRTVRVAPFVEASIAFVHTGTDSLFEPDAFYGGTRIGTFNLGARIAAGAHRPRMGRYGVAVAATGIAHGH